MTGRKNMNQMDGEDSPIFILGVTPRSGTNFLMDLLLQHPSCVRGRSPVNEDFFLEHAELLLEYVGSVKASWDPMWGDATPAVIDAFMKGLGDGLISFLDAEHNGRLVTKTPSVRNLEHFFDFFPTSKLLILIRDGRSVVQSCMDTFGWEFDRAALMWRDGARTIAQFEDTAGVSDRHRLVRYEDLVAELHATLTDIFEFLGLDSAAYDFEVAGRLPVRGSSFFYGPERSEVHWDPVAKDGGFDPLQRWRSWGRENLSRFEWIAGDELHRFGYEGPASAWKMRDSLKHRSLDVRWGARARARRLAYRSRVFVGRLTRPLRIKLGLTRDP